MSGAITPPSLPVVRERLAAGEPAQDLLKDVVEYVTSNKPCIPGVMVDLIVYLANHGARVATDEPGCAFDDLVSKPYRARSAVFMEVFCRLLGRPEELTFHILAKHGHLQLSDEMTSNPDLQSSLHARDSSGRTISHWLWDDQGHLVAKAAAIVTEQPGGDAERAHGWWLASVRQAWVLQQQLQALGVGLEIPDHSGVPALELCASRIDDGNALLVGEPELCQLVEAYQASRKLQAETRLPHGSPSVRSGPRL